MTRSRAEQYLDRDLPPRPKGAGSLRLAVDARSGYMSVRTHYQRDGARRVGPTVGVRAGRTPTETKRNVLAAWREAERRLDEVVGRVEQGEQPNLAAERRRVRDAVEAWLAAVAATSGTGHPTYAVYAAYARRHILPYAIAHRPLRELRDDDVVAWLGDLERAGASAHTRAYALDRLRQALKRASRTGRLENVRALVVEAVEVRPRHAPTETDPFTPDELARLIEAAEEHPEINGVPIGAMVAVCLYAKARIGEASALRTRDVGLFDDSLTIARQVRHGTRAIAEVKGKRASVVPVDHDLIDWLRRYLAGPDDLLFTWANAPSPAERVVTYSLASKAFLVLAERAGVEVRYATHRLRHSSGMLSVRAGTSVPQIQRAMRHRDIRTTMVYLDHADDELARRDASGVGAQLRKGARKGAKPDAEAADRTETIG